MFDHKNTLLMSDESLDPLEFVALANAIVLMKSEVNILSRPYEWRLIKLPVVEGDDVYSSRYMQKHFNFLMMLKG